MATLECGDCDRDDFRSAAGLASHRRWKHPEREGPDPVNAEALETTLSALRDMGRINPVDAAQVQMLRSMAASLDRDPSNAALWRLYRDSLEELVRADDRSDDSLDRALQEIQREASVGDEPT